MNLLEFLLPIRRNKNVFLFLIIIFSTLTWSILQFIPNIEKTTVYFTVKPIKTENINSSLDPVESSMKVAETISGWAKNPAFRQKILDNSGISIYNFKRKISARKQNRTNVFWTISLYGDEQKFSQKITDSLIKTFNKEFQDFNQNNSFPFGITNPTIFYDKQNIPFSWKIFASIILGIILALFFTYFYASFTGIISFSTQVKNIFKNSSILVISEKIGLHDVKLIEQFILTFDSPRLVGTFLEAEKHFSLAGFDEVNLETDTPILIVKIGQTKISELKNLRAIFGENLGIIIFER